MSNTATPAFFSVGSFYWEWPEMPLPLAAGMNGHIIMWASGARSYPTKFTPMPRLSIPRGVLRGERRAAGDRTRLNFMQKDRASRGQNLNQLFVLRVHKRDEHPFHRFVSVEGLPILLHGLQFLHGENAYDFSFFAPLRNVRE